MSWLILYSNLSTWDNSTVFVSGRKIRRCKIAQLFEHACAHQSVYVQRYLRRHTAYWCMGAHTGLHGGERSVHMRVEEHSHKGSRYLVFTTRCSQSTAGVGQKRTGNVERSFLPRDGVADLDAAHQLHDYHTPLDECLRGFLMFGRHATCIINCMLGQGVENFQGSVAGSLAATTK